MRTIKTLSVLLITMALLLTSCSSNSDQVTNQSNLAQSPAAKSQYDNSNFGIYKGVFVGSSGIIIVNVNNDNAISSAILIVDGTTYNFTTNQPLQQNQATTIHFVSGSNSFTFSVSANGNNPTFTNLIINGHPNAAIISVKETSTTLVKCYEGTYIGGEAGVFNALIYGNVIKALTKNSTNSSQTANGTVTNNQVAATGNVSSGATFVGTVSGNNFSGTWTNTLYNLNGTWTGSRTY